MVASNDNKQSTPYELFMNVSNEPLIMLTPIKGYNKMPFVSLETAVESLVPFIPEVEQMAYTAKQRCKKLLPDELSLDKSAAIMLFAHLNGNQKKKKLKRAISHPLGIEDYCCGSDPITHKKIREENTDETSCNMAQVESTSTSSLST
ncbi:unnamed protein product [Rotaria sp. Silwood2]|nr:unnamed protein product [Rotaria sp. Silwood2]CAF2709534.1 unnamed protein product [Rotaria sp. Silwood2]CAF3115199.1 unnamed protein product [Rotaria sp. Silwood2]CAF4201712.1 unnamed protein product [Rotaria sp. Silwood2]CAF4282968.1 unnamed protein product [Rotaria sp. Silwood2]